MKSNRNVVVFVFKRLFTIGRIFTLNRIKGISNSLENRTELIFSFLNFVKSPSDIDSSASNISGYFVDSLFCLFFVVTHLTAFCLVWMMCQLFLNILWIKSKEVNKNRGAAP